MKPRDRVRSGSRVGIILELSRRHRTARVLWSDSTKAEYENTLDLEIITKEAYDESVRKQSKGE